MTDPHFALIVSSVLFAAGIAIMHFGWILIHRRGHPAERFAQRAGEIEAVRVPSEGDEFGPREAAWLPEDTESQHDGSVLIHSAARTVEAKPGDWIIRDHRGDYHACAPALFAASFQPI